MCRQHAFSERRRAGLVAVWRTRGGPRPASEQPAGNQWAAISGRLGSWSCDEDPRGCARAACGSHARKRRRECWLQALDTRLPLLTFLCCAYELRGFFRGSSTLPCTKPDAMATHHPRGVGDAPAPGGRHEAALADPLHVVVDTVWRRCLRLAAARNGPVELRGDRDDPGARERPRGGLHDLWSVRARLRGRLHGQTRRRGRRELLRRPAARDRPG